MNPGPPYGDSDAERIRELIETGSSVRVTGKPILTALIEALQPEAEAQARREAAGDGTVPLRWTRLAQSGNWGAAGRCRYYSAGRTPLDGRWFLESWADDAAGGSDKTLRLDTLGAAKAEADGRAVAWPCRQVPGRSTRPR
jgi:hypothetical protein